MHTPTALPKWLEFTITRDEINVVVHREHLLRQALIIVLGCSLLQFVSDAVRAAGGESTLVRFVVAAPLEIPQGHVYRIGEVLPPFDDKQIRLRNCPRRFSFKNSDFRTNADSVSDGKTFAEFELKDLKV